MLSNNVFEAYEKASPRVKRLYLSLFWEGFWVKDRQIVKSEPTKLIKSLLDDENIFIKTKADTNVPTSDSDTKLRSYAENQSIACGGSHSVRIRTDWLRW